MMMSLGLRLSGCGGLHTRVAAASRVAARCIGTAGPPSWRPFKNGAPSSPAGAAATAAALITVTAAAAAVLAAVVNLR